MLVTCGVTAATEYVYDFQDADKALKNGHMALSTKDQANFWQKWCNYVQLLGVYPYLFGIQHHSIGKDATRFVAQVCQSDYSQGHRVDTQQAQVVLHAIRQTWDMVYSQNPFNVTAKNICDIYN